MPRPRKARRTIVKRKTQYLVRRAASGQFTLWTKKGKSIARDRQTNAKTRVPPGQGHRGDIRSHQPGWFGESRRHSEAATKGRRRTAPTERRR